MSVEIHAWVEIIPVAKYPPSGDYPVIAYTEAETIHIARYKAASGEWINHHSLELILSPVTYWAGTHKISRAIQDDIERHAEENSDED